MIYNGINFEKISKSEQQLQSLSLIGINYDKRLKKSLLEEYKNPSNIDESMIDDFEKEYDIELPNDYKKFLLATNGGRTSQSIFDISKNKDIVVNNFFTLLSKVIMYTLRNVNNGDLINFPKNFIAIADTVNGDYILLNVDKSDQQYGKVYGFLHETNELNNIGLSFDEFLDKLHG